MKRSFSLDKTLWTRNIIVLMASTFLLNFGMGLFRGVSTNFFVDTLNLSGKHILWLAGLREIPGLALMFIAALVMHLPLTRRAAVSVLLMGLGYALYAAVNSYGALIAVALLGSLGFHNWMPLQGVLAMGLAPKERAGQVLGTLSSVRALAAIIGMGLITLFARALSGVSLRTYYIAGGVTIMLASGLLLKLPAEGGVVNGGQQRLLLKRRYWLYYVLTFFEGSRMQVFGTFGTLVLVQNYGLQVWQISLVLLASGITNFAATPWLGRLIDRVGERPMLSASYVALALCFVGYATLHHALALGLILIAINLLVTLSMGLATYVNRIAPPEELTPTLSAGVSINHITSVTMSLLAGTLLSVVGYEGLCWGAAAIIALSVPFALAIRVREPVAAPASA